MLIRKVNLTKLVVTADYMIHPVETSQQSFVRVFSHGLRYSAKHCLCSCHYSFFVILESTARVHLFDEVEVVLEQGVQTIRTAGT